MKITISIVGNEQAAARFERMVPVVRMALRELIEKQAISLQRYVKSNKLNGQVLNVRTGRLRRNINTRIEETGKLIYGIVGTNVAYAHVHEYGWEGDQTVRAHLRRAKSGKESMVREHQRHVKLPERSFLRSALAERSDAIAQALRRGVYKSLNT